VAWNAALLRPDVFRAVGGMSVSYAPPRRVERLAALSQAGGRDCYLQYFPSSVSTLWSCPYISGHGVLLG
jgi:hypothetical protein